MPRPRKNAVCINCGNDISESTLRKFCSKKCYDEVRNARIATDKTTRLHRLYSAAKVRSENYGIPFNLDVEYLSRLWDDNNGCCAVTGIPFELTKLGTRRPHPYAPSIDKIKPDRGYVKGNVRLVCYQTNVAISDFGLEQFERFIDLYIQNKRSIGL